MMLWLRLIVVVFLAAFATGTYAQTTQATSMGLQMSTAMHDMNAPPVCDHCKTDAAHHSTSCDAYCLNAAIEAPTVSTERREAVSAPLELLPFWGFDGAPLSPVPPPPRTTILS